MLQESLTMSLGSGVSGWVAANGKAIINADSHLDLALHKLKLSASRCLAVPVHLKGDTIGVISAYLDDPRGFSERDVAFLEGTARTLQSSPFAILLESALAGAPKITPKQQAPTIH
jgi:putative methionine-R-sulfoxide reductase with GAF domain